MYTSVERELNKIFTKVIAELVADFRGYDFDGRAKFDMCLVDINLNRRCYQNAFDRIPPIHRFECLVGNSVMCSEHVCMRLRGRRRGSFVEMTLT